MLYMKVVWRTSNVEDPIEIYQEIANDGYEQRKVEYYLNGRFDYTNEQIKTGSTWLSPKKIIEVEEINQDEQFYAKDLSKEEFELVWQKALKYHG